MLSHLVIGGHGERSIKLFGCQKRCCDGHWPLTGRYFKRYIFLHIYIGIIYIYIYIHIYIYTLYIYINIIYIIYIHTYNPRERYSKKSTWDSQKNTQAELQILPKPRRSFLEIAPLNGHRAPSEIHHILSEHPPMGIPHVKFWYL